MKIVLSTLTAAGLSAALADWTAPAPATEYVVRIEQNFQPDNLEIKIGDTVIWKNFDSEPHTVTAKPTPTLTPEDGSFDSGEIPSGVSFREPWVRGIRIRSEPSQSRPVGIR
jgi:plastocyanin